MKKIIALVKVPAAMVSVLFMRLSLGVRRAVLGGGVLAVGLLASTPAYATASNPTTITDFKSAAVGLFTSNVGFIGIGLIALMTAGLALGVGRTFLSKVWGMLVSLGGRNPVGGGRRR